ncbi:pyridoxal phosphate-dependent aminotransferase [Candidatus Methylacidithermus pantelleriae]|nr:aminotransferase class I/II-fold pyridoxal phosphate-dependent enzyme [Candidatus Methylacidithermus pantelleriae]
MKHRPREAGEFIARHVRSVPRSGIRDFFELVQGVPDVVSLGIGEPGFATPWHIREAAIYALEKGKTGYTSNLGLWSLRESIAQRLEERYGVQYDPASEILITVGVSEGLDIALRSVLEPGDEVLYHEPSYVSYAPTVALAHAKPVPIPSSFSTGFRLDFDRLQTSLSPRSKVLILNFPTNPTGAMLSRDELEEVARLAQQWDLLVISDEIYSEITYEEPHFSIAALPGMKERTILLDGFSKSFAMTGFRIGYVCAPAPLIEAMMKIHQYTALCASIISQEAAIEALEAGEMDIERTRHEYRLRRNFLWESFQAMGLPSHKPRATFYLFASIRDTGLSSRQFALELLKNQKVAVVPGDAFGPSGEGFIRCSFAARMEVLEEAVKRMEQFLHRPSAKKPAISIA